jgi:hypothetical protein
MTATTIAEISTHTGHAVVVEQSPDGTWVVKSNGTPRHTSKDPNDIIRALAHYAHYERTTGECFVIAASTGCTCCASDNFYAGPWRTREQAQAATEGHTANRTLASQYARSGRYTIMEATYERLPDGRLILDGDYVVDHDFLPAGDLGGHLYGYRD